MRKWTYVVIHHTAAEEKNIEQIRRYHRGLGWRDIGYHFVIEKDGQVAQGRSLDLPGAHCKASGMNFKAIGIALIGNFDNHPPAEVQVEALVRLLHRLIAEHSISPANVTIHRLVPGAATRCPGRYFPWERVKGELTAGSVQFAKSPGRVQPDDPSSGPAPESPPSLVTPPVLPPQSLVRGAVDRGPEEPSRHVVSGSGSTRLWRVQAGAFKDRAHAEALAARLKQAGFDAYIWDG